jgi:IrrE N-terminal-like domain
MPVAAHGQHRVAFSLGHELGHIRFQHKGYAGVPVAAAQANERQVDQFGLELMRRVGEILMGA